MHIQGDNLSRWIATGSLTNSPQVNTPPMGLNYPTTGAGLAHGSYGTAQAFPQMPITQALGPGSLPVSTRTTTTQGNYHGIGPHSRGEEIVPVPPGMVVPSNAPQRRVPVPGQTRRDTNRGRDGEVQQAQPSASGSNDNRPSNSAGSSKISEGICLIPGKTFLT